MLAPTTAACRTFGAQWTGDTSPLRPSPAARSSTVSAATPRSRRSSRTPRRGGEKRSPPSAKPAENACSASTDREDAGAGGEQGRDPPPPQDRPGDERTPLGPHVCAP